MDVRQTLRRRYLDSMPRKIEALEHALDGLRDGADGALKVRALAHQLVGSGATYGFDEVTKLALSVEIAPDMELAGHLRCLITHLLDVYGRVQSEHHERVLLIEDDPDIAMALNAAARAFTDDVTEVRSGAAATAALADNDYTLIVLDLVLPDVDGREILRMLRDARNTANTPVVVVTATTGKQARLECVTLGVDHFLEKPVDLDLLTATIGAAFRRGRTFRLEARRDPLTGLRNRAGFRESLDLHLSLAKRNREPISLVLIDVDHFKAVNDTYGHSMGDRVLKALAETLRLRLRTSDIVARWGGEEFVVAFPSTTVSGAAVAARKISAAFSAQQHTLAAATVSGITFSGGAVQLGLDATLEDTLENADRLLYQAKMAGRDRILEEAPAELNEQVLVAEDDPDTAHMIRTVLEGNGMRVQVCTTGRSALDEAQKQRFAAIILDWQLPQMAGDEVLRHLRARPECNDVAIMMVTAIGDERSVAEAFKHGADDYVFKPFRPKELVARLRRLLARPRVRCGDAQHA